MDTPAAVATPDFWSNLSHAVSIAVAIFTALLPVILPMLPALINFIGGFFKDARHRRVFDAVSRAGLAAASVGAAKMREALLAAQAPDSPGGSAITPEEQQGAIKAAVAAGMDYLVRQGIMKEAVKVYGSEDTVQQSIEAIVQHKWWGSSVGPSPMGGGWQGKTPAPLPEPPATPQGITLSKAREVEKSIDHAIGGVMEKLPAIRKKKKP